MGRETDVFVIGGGPAGLAAALAVRKKGFRVMVADGAKPPIEKACGEGLMPDALEALRELGVVIQLSDGYAFRGLRCMDESSTVDADFPNGMGVGLRRPALHQKMIDQAGACGVSLMWEKPVIALRGEEVELAGGEKIRAKWIIGADGSASRVRKWSGLEGYEQLESRFAFRRHYHVKPWTDRVEIHWGESMEAYVTPVGAEEVCVVVMSQRQNGRVDETLREFPALAESLRGVAPASAERGGVTLTHRLERVHRDNVALVGDASGSVDVITGEGLRLSFHQAKALAEALELGDLDRYQRAHRQLGRRPSLMGQFMMLLDRQPNLRRRALRAFKDDQGLFARVISVHVGGTSAMHMATTGAYFSWKFLWA